MVSTLCRLSSKVLNFQKEAIFLFTIGCAVFLIVWLAFLPPTIKTRRMSPTLKRIEYDREQAAHTVVR